MGVPGIGLVEILITILIAVVFFAALYLVVVRALKNASPQSTQPFRNTKALDTLKERYARGDINQEEYQRMSKDLKS